MNVEPIDDKNVVSNRGRWDVEVGVDLRVVVHQPTPTIHGTHTPTCVTTILKTILL